MGRVGKVGFLTQILIAFVVAVIAGIIFGPSVKIVQPLGDLFLRLITFLIVPLILSTLVVGIASTGSMKTLGRMGGKTIIYYFSTTIVAVLIGLAIGTLFSPGSGINITPTGDVPNVTDSGGIINILLNIVPTNPIASLADGDILQTIFIAIFIGLGITMAGEKAQPVYRLFEGFAEVMYKITGVVMKIVPLGIFGLLAPIIGEYGLSVIIPLGKLFLAVATACIIHIVVVYSISVKTLGKTSPLKFFKGIAPAALVAFSTQSSSGTLPITIKDSEDHFGISKKVTGFVLPLGATINMDGQSIYLSIAALFTAQFYGIDLTVSQILIIVLISSLGSIGTAGVPGAGIIMLSLVLTSVNLPLEGIALIAGIDRFLNMFSTATNVMGDVSAALYVNASENEKDRNQEPEMEMVLNNKTSNF